MIKFYRFVVVSSHFMMRRNDAISCRMIIAFAFQCLTLKLIRFEVAVKGMGK